MDLFTIMFEYGRWSSRKIRPLLQDELCHHLLIVCYVTIEIININIHVLEIHKMKEEHVTCFMLNYIQTFPDKNVDTSVMLNHGM